MFSCPGKVLIIGGYTVLEHPNRALVLTTTTKFHSVARWVHGGSVDGLSISVFSRQFHQKIDLYVLDNTIRNIGTDTNKYVEVIVKHAIQYYMKPYDDAKLEIDIFGDNDFYSQRDSMNRPYTVAQLSKLEPFRPLPKDVVSGKVMVSKTGLGSSSAMTAAVVSSVMRLINPAVTIDEMYDVAQTTHNEMQGKIGSGFDIYAAFYGSCQYVRSMKNAEPYHLPKRVVLLCGDVCGGSDSPGMSRHVLKLRGTHEWSQLVDANHHCIDVLRSIDDRAVDSWDNICQLRNAFEKVRTCLRAIGELSGQPVEPPEQTELCDATQELPGVLICGVPGAGGFDAVFALVVDTYLPEVERFWAERNVCALNTRSETYKYQ